MLEDKEVLISNKKALTILMSNYFVNITADLELQRNRETLSETSTGLDGMKKNVFAMKVF